MMEVFEAQPGARFDWLTEYRNVENLIAGGQAQQIGPYIRSVAQKHADSRYLHILLGMICQRMNASLDGVKSFEAAIAMATDEPLPDLNSPATQMYLASQLSLAEAERPCSQRAAEHLAKNLQALRTVDPVLADAIEKCSVDQSIQLIDLWGRLHLFDPRINQVILLSDAFVEQVQPWLDQWAPMAITAVNSGQELLYCLFQQKQFPLGRKRIIYLFEENLSGLRLQLQMANLSNELAEQQVVLFGGEHTSGRVERFFGNWRYSPPHVTIGDTQRIENYQNQINSILDPTDAISQAEEYYRSSEFQERLVQISDGKIRPRVLVYTSRWTSFLKHCARDFQHAFEKIGCETYLMIEESDVQTLTAKVTLKHLVEAKPDFLFSVSHTRPSFCIPHELPVVSFIQDRCGPVLSLKELGGRISRRDLFVCMMTDFKKYLISKGVPEDQIAVMPIPADETMFHPLGDDHPDASAFTVDVGFVKHCDVYGDKALEHFIENQLDQVKRADVKEALTTVLTDLYRTTCRNDGRRHYEDQMQQYVLSRFTSPLSEEFAFELNQLVSTFYIGVFANTWRYQFLEALAEAKIEVGLYGNGWDKHPRFSRFSRGPVDRNTALNKVYNFNRINLNIHPSGTMHQRVSECALAGGFMIGTRHDPQKDWEPIDPYFEPGKEIVLYDSAEDLVDKCRYYLAHPNERRDIAERAHRRAIREQTTVCGAQKVLADWAKILSRRQVS